MRSYVYPTLFRAWKFHPIHNSLWTYGKKHNSIKWISRQVMPISAIDAMQVDHS